MGEMILHLPPESNSSSEGNLSAIVVFRRNGDGVEGYRSGVLLERIISALMRWEVFRGETIHSPDRDGSIIRIADMRKGGFVARGSEVSQISSPWMMNSPWWPCLALRINMGSLLPT